MISNRGLILPQLMESRTLQPKKVVFKKSLLAVNKKTGQVLTGSFEEIAEEIGTTHSKISFCLHRDLPISEDFEIKRLKPARVRAQPVSSKIYYITDGQQVLNGTRAFIEATTSIILTKAHYGGTTLMGHCWAVGISAKNAVDRLKRLEHKRKRVKNGKIIYKAKKGAVTFEMDAKELGKIIGVKEKTIATAIGKTCAGYSIELSKPKRIIL